MTYQDWIRKQYEEGRGLSWQPKGADVWEAATRAERERCAKLCEEIARERVPLAAALGADDCATAILRSAS